MCPPQSQSHPRPFALAMGGTDPTTQSAGWESTSDNLMEWLRKQSRAKPPASPALTREHFEAVALFRLVRVHRLSRSAAPALPRLPTRGSGGLVLPEMLV